MTHTKTTNYQNANHSRDQQTDADVPKWHSFLLACSTTSPNMEANQMVLIFGQCGAKGVFLNVRGSSKSLTGLARKYNSVGLYLLPVVSSFTGRERAFFITRGEPTVLIQKEQII